MDRVAAHCINIRVRIAENRYNPFRTRARASFTGGMQLSLDMAKAFDRVPRTLLLRSLECVHAPADLIILIMFIHDNACAKFQRNQHSQVIHTGSGIRQGCGLAPLLRAAYSLLLFSTMLRHLNVDQLTGFADDLHMQWRFDQPRQFKNACAQVGFILRDLRQAGMQVSADKTVILLALSGQSYGPDIKPFLRKTRSGRCLKVHDGEHEVLLPIKQQHTYRGVVIGYQHFERATMRHRLHLSWQAFHRLHTFLCSKKVELGQRLRLRRTCVLSIANYGLTAIGLDEVSASKLRSHVYRQLRIITGNPAHLTLETNASLAQRHSTQDPVLEVYQRALRRVEQSRHTLLHLQGTTVQQRWSQLLSELVTYSENIKGEKGNLTEVTQVVRIQHSRTVCGQLFGSFHALRTHVGKAHPKRASPSLSPRIRRGRLGKMSTLSILLMAVPTAGIVRNNLVVGQLMCLILINEHVPFFTRPHQKRPLLQRAVLLMGRTRRRLMLQRTTAFRSFIDQIPLPLPNKASLNHLPPMSGDFASTATARSAGLSARPLCMSAATPLSCMHRLRQQIRPS